jgi:hypothetical protein
MKETPLSSTDNEIRRSSVWIGAVQSVDGNTLRLADPLYPAANAVRVLMPLDALGHPPAALPGEMWRIVGTAAAEGSEGVIVAESMERIILR